MVQAAFTHMASEIAAIVGGLVMAGGAVVATSRSYIRRTIDSMLTAKVHDEVTDQMAPLAVKIDDLCDAQEKADHRRTAEIAEFDGRLRTIEAIGNKTLGIVEGLHANQ